MTKAAHATGFTLVEVLATMSLLAIALPAIMEGVTLSLSAGGQAKQQAQASSFAYGKMAEIVAQAQWDQTSLSGDFGADYPGFRWTAQVIAPMNTSLGVALTGADGTAEIEELDVTVFWHHRKGEASVMLSTLVDTGGTQ